MKLLGSLTSPFVRQVRVVLIEKGLDSQVLLDETNPFSDPAALLAANPLGKVPALVDTPIGTVHDSRLICEYLDALHPEPALLPGNSAARWEALQQWMTAIGVMDAAAAHVMESRRDDGMVSPAWQQRRERAMQRGSDALAQAVADDPRRFHLGDIGTAVALAYLDFRHPQIDWRARHPALAQWLDVVSERPAMHLTQPPQ
ncbi:MAG: glutathione S-transferase N-terminal domain-containing protein [Oceanococcaceae bacterium]